MSRLATSFVLGYHGCDLELAHRVVNEGTKLIHSDRDHDWLGPGAYFWESDPQRAWEWARARAEAGHLSVPAVIGAVIDLRNCLDLTARDDVELVRTAYESFVSLREKSGLPLPRNKDGRGHKNDLLLRYLDCAVLRHLHEMIDLVADDEIQPFDSIRGMFVEGGELFPGSGIQQNTHTQIAIRNDDCIKGLFFPMVNGQRQFN